MLAVGSFPKRTLALDVTGDFPSIHPTRTLTVNVSGCYLVILQRAACSSEGGRSKLSHSGLGVDTNYPRAEEAGGRRN